MIQNVKTSGYVGMTVTNEKITKKLRTDYIKFGVCLTPFTLEHTVFSFPV